MGAKVGDMAMLGHGGGGPARFYVACCLLLMVD